MNVHDFLKNWNKYCDEDQRTNRDLWESKENTIQLFKDKRLSKEPKKLSLITSIKETSDNKSTVYLIIANFWIGEIILKTILVFQVEDSKFIKLFQNYFFLVGETKRFNKYIKRSMLLSNLTKRQESLLKYRYNNCILKFSEFGLLFNILNKSEIQIVWIHHSISVTLTH